MSFDGLNRSAAGFGRTLQESDTRRLTVLWLLIIGLRERIRGAEERRRSQLNRVVLSPFPQGRESKADQKLIPPVLQTLSRGSLLRILPFKPEGPFRYSLNQRK